MKDSNNSKYEVNLSKDEEIPVSAKPSDGKDKLSVERLHNVKKATTSLLFFAYVVAYTLQSSLVIDYVENNLLLKYNVSTCESEESNNDDSSNETSSENSTREAQEQCEEEFKKWNLYLTILFAIPAFVLAPFVASWSDGLNRVLPVYVTLLAMVISTLATALAIYFSASNETVTFCLYPCALTGGVTIMTIIIFGYEAERLHGFEIFERYIQLAASNVSALAVCQVTLTVLNYYLDNVVNNIVIWVPMVSIFLGIASLLYARSQVIDSRRGYLEGRIWRKLFAVEFSRLCKWPQGLFILLLFVCAFFYYFDYVGEILEVTEILTENKAWQISSFSKQGAVQSVTSSIGLFIALYMSKKVVEKKLVDQHLLPIMTLSYVGLLAVGLDFITKIIVSFVSTDAQLWVPIIGVICELAITVVRYFAVMLVPPEDAAKPLSLLAWAQLISIVPAPLFVQALYKWSETFWSNFVYIFMAILLIVPCLFLWIVGKFGKLHETSRKEVEEKEESLKDGKEPFEKFEELFKRWRHEEWFKEWLQKTEKNQEINGKL